ncbi:GNS1/SUR4 family [Novymonas esmeraldas]|uniref:Elongation of fatty acids protein n=1 Tax=Novymonas esmeraldas TaxID=1808958 RepID=A0AAW0EZT6_9TRYP
MASAPARTLWESVVNIPHAFDSDGGLVFFHEYSDILQYTCVAYTMLIILGPRAMAGRDAFELTHVTRLWNLILATFSIMGSVYCVTLLLYMTESRSFYEVTCRFDYNLLFDGAFSFWVFSFMVAKLPEMLDTLFLCLRKKPITFLHAYHHLTVAVFSWCAGSRLLPSGIWFATMNYVVHSVMYSYYLACSCGLKRVVAPVAPFITVLQLSQMLFGYAICLYTGFHTFLSRHGCDADPLLIRMGLLMYGSYFALFLAFFAARYVRAAPRRPRSIAATSPHH